MYIPMFQKFATGDMQQCVLRNCSVVIDAQCFFYDFYYESRLNDVFGCEGNGFVAYLKKKLYIFKKCNIKCYFVFKGGDADIVKKISKFKTTSLNFDLYDITRTNVFPIFATEIIKQVLEDLNVSYSVCLTEAIEECVALAEQLGCAVISKNTSFCFRNVPYIPHFSWDYNKTKDGILCKQYTLEDFLTKHSLTMEKIAIFAIISDIHLYPKEVFQPLLQDWGILDDDILVQYNHFMDWLSRHSETEILNKIREGLSQENNTSFMETYVKKVRGMRHAEGGVVANYLCNDKRLSVSYQDPEWFEKGVTSNIIPAAYINLYKWKMVQGSTAIESKTPVDSILLSMDIILYAYNLMTNFKEDNITVYHNADNYTVFNTRNIISKPEYNCRECVFENGWSDIKDYKLFEHFLRENCINPKCFSNLEQMLLIPLVYFARKKKLDDINVDEEVYCIIICYVMLTIVFNKEGSYSRRCSNVYESDCNEAKYATERYFQLDDEEARQIFNGDTLKTFVEFQYCFLHLQYLNILCGSPNNSVWCSRFNGTFVYKLLLDMRGTDNDLFITTLFERAPSVLVYIKRLVKLYKDLFNDI